MRAGRLAGGFSEAEIANRAAGRHWRRLGGGGGGPLALPVRSQYQAGGFGSFPGVAVQLLGFELFQIH